MTNIANEAQIIGETHTAQKGLGANYSPPAVAAPARRVAAPPEVGPTTFWGRIGQVGIGQVNLLNAAKLVKNTAVSVVNDATTIGKGMSVAEGQTSGATQNQQNKIAQQNKFDITNIKSAGSVLKSPTATPQQKAQAQQDLKTIMGNSDNAYVKQNAQNVADIKNTNPQKQGGASFNILTDLIGGGEGKAAVDVGKGIATDVGKGLALNAAKTGVKATAKKIAEPIVGNAIVGAAQGGVGAVEQKGAKTTPGDVLKGAAVGAASNAALTAGGVVAGKVFGKALTAAGSKVQAILGKGPDKALADVKANPPKSLPELSETQVKSMTPQKIPVTDTSTPSAIGVKSPLKVGVKDVSSTDKVQVRTPPTMSDKQYVTQFNKISKSYDVAQKQLESKPPAAQKVLASAVDNQHLKALQQLDDSYHNPQVSEGTSKVTNVEKSTTPAAKLTGGSPKGFVNTTGEKTLDNTKLSDLPQSREASTLQTQIEKAHNAGDDVTASKLITKLPSDMQDSTRSSLGIKDSTPDGTLKTAGSATRIQKAALEKDINIRSEDLPKYESMNMKEQAGKVADLVNNDRQKAVDIIDGKASAPAGVDPHFVHVALEKVAMKDGDADLLTKLANSHINAELSGAGQKLRIAAERDPNSPVERMRQIKEAREEAFEKKSGTTAAKATSQTAKEIGSKIKAPSKLDWQTFVEGIKC